MNLKMLNAMIRVSKIEVSELAKMLDMSCDTLEAKLDNRLDFYGDEIYKISCILSISDPNIFYLT